jgi:hypothetical protein
MKMARRRPPGLQPVPVGQGQQASVFYGPIEVETRSPAWISGVTGPSSSGDLS